MSQEHTIQTIVTALNETDDRPRGQIAAIVRALGEEAALALLVEANEIERSGGMMLPDGSRRRTPGGVYFTLARRRLSPEDREAIFPKTPQAPKKDPEKADNPRPERTEQSLSTTESAAKAPLIERIEKRDVSPGRPDRRHVRLIRPGEPVRPRLEPVPNSPAVSTTGVGPTAMSSTHAQPAATAEAPKPSNGAEPGKPEVKLVRLDRRRIVPLRAPPPPSTPTPPLRKTAVPQGQANTQASSASSKPPTSNRGTSEIDRAFERSQVKKGLKAQLSGMDLEQQRLVLLDLLTEISDEPPDLTPARTSDPELRGRILAAVGKRLEIPLGRLALTIYGADTPANRRRVKALTETQR